MSTEFLSQAILCLENLDYERLPEIGIESSSKFPGDPGLKFWVKIRLKVLGIGTYHRDSKVKKLTFTYEFFKWAKNGLFLFIFVLFT